MRKNIILLIGMMFIAGQTILTQQVTLRLADEEISVDKSDMGLLRKHCTALNSIEFCNNMLHDAPIELRPTTIDSSTFKSLLALVKSEEDCTRTAMIGLLTDAVLKNVKNAASALGCASLVRSLHLNQLRRSKRQLIAEGILPNASDSHIYWNPSSSIILHKNKQNQFNMWKKFEKEWMRIIAPIAKKVLKFNMSASLKRLAIQFDKTDQDIRFQIDVFNLNNDWSEWTQIATIPLNDSCRTFYLNPDGAKLALLEDKRFTLFDIATGKCEKHLPVEPLKYFKVTTASCSWSPHGNSLMFYEVVSTETKIIDVQKETIVTLFSGKESVFLKAFWTPDGSLIAARSQKKSIVFWDAQHLKPNGSICVDHDNNISGFADFTFSPDSKMIAVRGDRGGAIYDIESQDVIQDLPYPIDSKISWSPDGKKIAYFQKDKISPNIAIFDVSHLTPE